MSSLPKGLFSNSVQTMFLLILTSFLSIHSIQFYSTVYNYIVGMIFTEAPKITAMLASLIIGKAAIITTLSLAFGISFANAQLTGLLLAQGGD